MSKFWDKLANKHKGVLGLSHLNFKRSVNNYYYQWGTIGILRREWRMLFKTSFFDWIKYLSIWKIHIKGMFNFLKPFLIVEEPILGNPKYILIDGERVSQDLCHSVSEYKTITKFINPSSIIEIGAGYGRLAYVFLHFNPKIKMTIIDIEPALSVCKWYLTSLFPNANITFLHPEEKYYANNCDLMINVSSFDEMTREEIFDYLKFASLKSEYLYIKEHKRSNKKDNAYISQQEYPINGELLYQADDKITTGFFEAIYKLK